MDVYQLSPPMRLVLLVPGYWGLERQDQSLRWHAVAVLDNQAVVHVARQFETTTH